MKDINNLVVRKVVKVSCWIPKDSNKPCYKVTFDDDSFAYLSDYKLFNARNNLEYFKKEV